MLLVPEQRKLIYRLLFECPDALISCVGVSLILTEILFLLILCVPLTIPYILHVINVRW